ncbi:dehydrase and lipid transport-domain-containing protein [Dipodascopsis tothii]|uniref:dehydrase and lipid transport-domain-containing protein n=1 Tax=Dipodascopsis tothii TaxID=44089 RepID=UPI0034CF4070
MLARYGAARARAGGCAGALTRPRAGLDGTGGPTRVPVRTRVPTRTFFELPNVSALAGEQTYKLSRVLRHRPDRLYAVVSDIDAYERFIPYCKRSKVTARDGAGEPAEATLGVGWQSFDESFESRLTCTRPTVVVAEALNRTVFRTLYTRWTLAPAAGGRHTRVDFELRFWFQNPLYNAAASSFGGAVSELMIAAFEKRARELDLEDRRAAREAKRRECT